MFYLIYFPLAMQTSVLRVLPQARHTLTVARQMSSVVSSPPTVRIPFAEKLVHGLFIAGGCLATPIWVLVNIKNYRGTAQ